VLAVSSRTHNVLVGMALPVVRAVMEVRVPTRFTTPMKSMYVFNNSSHKRKKKVTYYGFVGQLHNLCDCLKLGLRTRESRHIFFEDVHQLDVGRIIERYLIVVLNMRVLLIRHFKHSRGDIVYLRGNGVVRGVVGIVKKVFTLSSIRRGNSLSATSPYATPRMEVPFSSIRSTKKKCPVLPCLFQ